MLYKCRKGCKTKSSSITEIYVLIHFFQSYCMGQIGVFARPILATGPHVRHPSCRLSTSSSPLGPLHLNHRLTYFTIVPLPLFCLSPHRYPLRMCLSSLYPSVCAAACLSPPSLHSCHLVLICILTLSSLFLSPTWMSVHWVLLKGLFNLFVSQVSIPPGLQTSTPYPLLSPFSPHSSSLFFHLEHIVPSCFH